MKSIWRCLPRHRVLQYEPGFAGRIVNACAVLHNMRNADGIFDDEFAYDEHMYENDCDDDIEPDNNLREPLAIARRIQDRLIAEIFAR